MIHILGVKNKAPDTHPTGNTQPPKMVVSDDICDRVYLFTGLDHCTGPLDWTTGLDYWTHI